MIGELLREAAVLIGVLAPLESIVSKEALTFWGIVIIVVLVLVLAGAGIVIEVKRA